MIKNMKLRSSAFENGKVIPPRYTCDGEGISPPLEISDVPKEAVSLVLCIDDPDGLNGVFVNWLVWNIKPKNQEIKRNSKIAGAIEGVNSLGRIGYTAPCPPTTTHVYLFKIYALDILLPKNPTLTKKEIRELMDGHIIERAILRGFYERAHSESF